MTRLAASQYAIELIETWEAYTAHLSAVVREAKSEGAELLLLPEYSAMTLTGQLPPDIRSDLHRSIEEIQPMIPSWVELCEELARQHQILFQPGSAPVKDPDGKFRNRAWLFGPDGLIGYQDKQIMTRFEREQWNIHAGVEGLKAFNTQIGRLGILICYDNEFPMLGRRLAELGVELVLAPSCTDTLAGAYRVRIGAQARALENQYAVLSSPTAGEAPWSPAVDENRGRAALYVPSDYGMPASGIVAESESDAVTQSSLLIADIDLAAVARLRTEGQVATRRDWPEQFAI
ncbi:carbon-nitrogen hydrolase family protein [Rhizobium pusense]|jgi:predicted amidohydrolase|uniref:Carbon-nitrogen hydrolase n=1 Tax=Agrobacterium genomosp. 2 str. CFBP 5494 TaxID=1183436 RepID=A0A9W5B184_9HYPH|nr:MULTISPECIES: carbon-nitrogen hydrolase family protein [Rhizobium/Agrobacterium group]AMD60585.1 amidohydrolase [Agrobacterium tumefaciens]TGR69235.1 amidohydrolase [bacterium M00.F.Ca.ET.194.01.1.1]TGS54774.1 amidohydrolase [bacterium M00.F.Ca.ET.179.01.1.1]TGV47650.1 amidohydrolase [bacterium M00.F.Ca.ET.168.01.1.1]HCJ71532.1 amidohydrolase [Agrobacterium sp.]